MKIKRALNHIAQKPSGGGVPLKDTIKGMQQVESYFAGKAEEAPLAPYEGMNPQDARKLNKALLDLAKKAGTSGESTPTTSDLSQACKDRAQELEGANGVSNGLYEFTGSSAGLAVIGLAIGAAAPPVGLAIMALGSLGFIGGLGCVVAEGVSERRAEREQNDLDVAAKALNQWDGTLGKQKAILVA